VKKRNQMLKRATLFTCFLLITSVLTFTNLILSLDPPAQKSLSTSPSDLDFVPSYSVHAPIRITNNSAFSLLGFPGSGIPSNPYLIQGYDITVTGHTNAIWINGTNVHFEIRDCYLDVGTFNGDSIYLDEVTNGKVWNNTIITSDFADIYGQIGVYMHKCSTINLMNNTFDVVSWAVFADESDNIVVDDNNFDGNDYGIYFRLSEFCQVSNNYLECGTDTSLGILFDHSNYSTISNNDVLEFGTCVNLASSSNNEIIQNNCSSWYEGIYLYGRSMYNTIEDNICKDYISGSTGIAIANSPKNTVTENNILTAGYGLLIYDSNQTNVLENSVYDCISESAGIGIWLTNSDNCFFEGNRLNNTNYGIYLDSSDDNTVTTNRLSWTNNSGIIIHNCDSNEISMNTVEETGFDYGLDISGMSFFNDFYKNNIINSTGGLCLSSSINGTFTRNLFENTETSLFIDADCENNTISWNLFKNYITTDVNNDSDIIDYNYWSEHHAPDNNGDGIIDTPYSLVSMNQDPHPLKYRPIDPKWAHTPLDVHLEYPSDVEIDLEVNIGTLGPPEDYWWISDTVNFYLDENNTIRSNMQMDVGEYPLNIHAYNLYGYFVEASISVFIHDTTFPVVSQPDDLVYEEGTTGHNLTWTGFDLAPNSYSITLDGAVAKSGAWNSSSDSITFSVAGLDVGEHACILFLTDRGDNTVNSTVIVTVTAIPITTTTTTTETTTSETTASSTTTTDSQPLDDTLVILALGIGIGVTACVLVLIISRRR